MLTMVRTTLYTQSSALTKCYQLFEEDRLLAPMQEACGSGGVGGPGYLYRVLTRSNCRTGRAPWTCTTDRTRLP